MTKPDRKIEPKRLRGFRDHLPHTMNVRFSIIDIIRKVASDAGFHFVQTPALEYLEVLLGQGSEETDKQVYSFKDHGGRDVGLRFDLTVPFARFVAEHQNDLNFPFKRLQIGDVWRGENTQKGRYREFCQCDLDIIGVNSLAADVEVLLCIYNILSQVDFGSFTILIGHRPILSALIRKAFPNITPEGEIQALIALDKLEKIGVDGIVSLLTSISGCSTEGSKELIKFVTTKTNDKETDISFLEKTLATDAHIRPEIERLKNTFTLLKNQVNPNLGKLKLDISIARGLSYYNGIVYETFIDSLPGFGSVSSGGRYNDLASRFMNRELPGVGGSVGLDRLIAGLEELGKIPVTPPAVKETVYVAIATDDAVSYAFSMAERLRKAGIKTDIGLAPGKLSQQFKYANRASYPYVVTVGSAEQESHTFSLKYMASGEEEKNLPVDQIVDKIKNLFYSSK